MARRTMTGYFVGMDCCGCREFQGLNDGRYLKVEDIVLDVVYGIHHSDECAHVIFNGVVSHKTFWGDDLFKYVKANKLGLIVRTRAKRNPNSGNMIKAYLWTPNKAAWLHAQKLDPDTWRNYDNAPRRWGL